MAEAISPVARAEEVIGNIASETGLSMAEVKAALERQLAVGNLVKTEGGNIYNPAQPFLPGMSLEESYK